MPLWCDRLVSVHQVEAMAGVARMCMRVCVRVCNLSVSGLGGASDHVQHAEPAELIALERVMWECRCVREW